MADTGLILGAADEDQRLIQHLSAAGYTRVEPAILHPAEWFLDQSGEEMRGRLLLTTDPNGAEYCLRPEYTIPVCREYLASPDAGKPAKFSYLGPVFKHWWDAGAAGASRGRALRHRADAPSELAQAGVESLGLPPAEAAAADADILALTLEAVEAAGGAQLSTTMGDAGLFNEIVRALDLPPGWARRIRRGHMRGQSLEAILAPPPEGAISDHSGVLAALGRADHAGARALVGDLMSIAGVSSVGGRTAGEIADRFLEQAAMRAESGVTPDKRAALERFLAIAGDPDACSAALRTLAREAGLDIHTALDAFDERLGFIAARGVDMSRLRFEASFGRKLDYYTGFVFEARGPSGADSAIVAGGGRYDGLLKALGAKADIPAVGAAIWREQGASAGAAS